ncbi:MAG: fumarylacetoacetate hydrolase family protein [Alphaproteobacteria bacterium]|nr:fumarylacetoacetate hydrolase family protein [Alphaproteobacteria bacterium]
MKFVRYGQIGAEKPGFVDGDGRLRDLSAVLPDLTGDALDPQALADLAARDASAFPEVEGKPRLGAPVGGVGKFIGIGLNYTDHAEEVGASVPKEPVVFMKATSSICGPRDEIVLPRDSEATDWEVELAVVIGRKAKYVAASDALDCVAGYTICIDVSERSYQNERGGQWTKGKSCDSFGPLGPWLVPAGKVRDPQQLGLWLEVDGDRKQFGSTELMIFPVAEIIAYLSTFFTLHPGDVIVTGTPAGVGHGMSPRQYLRPGNKVECGIDGLGEQQHFVTADG